ncbi:DUF6286 domain-containing protein [Streptomyces johnsoniae]|uniref:DUF6286 domain-containing protein n=1 Tax=Streptomyces johnsoniae TaxID=3075532 RepID=UPI00374E1DD5
MTGPAGPSGHEGAAERTAPTLEKAPPVTAEAPAGPAEEPAEPGGGVAAGRFWSERRGPAALVAVVLMGASGLLLYDVVSVRAGRPAASWRRTLADDLAARPLDDAWVVVAAAAAVLAGVWLIVLAVTPGLRGLLPMRRDSELMRPGIERGAAAAVLRHRALEVSGVRSVRVNVGRRRVRALAEAHFRELDVVHADLDAVLTHGIRELGLARQPALSVHVRRPPRR